MTNYLDYLKGFRACRCVQTDNLHRISTCRRMEEDNLGHRELVDAPSKMEGIKEQAIASLEQILSGLEGYIYEPFRQSFICGYLLSLLSSGSLNHLDFIRSYLQKYRAAMLWYGLCAGLRPRSEVLELY